MVLSCKIMMFDWEKVQSGSPSDQRLRQLQVNGFNSMPWTLSKPNSYVAALAPKVSAFRDRTCEKGPPHSPFSKLSHIGDCDH